MIIANLDMLEPFKSLSSNMRIAIEYLEKTDIGAVADGHHELAGDRVYVMVTSYFTSSFTDREYETHDNYIDIHCLLSGREAAFYADKRSLLACGEYLPEKDKRSFEGTAQEAVLGLQPGIAAIFFPNDAHKVCCQIESPEPVRKLLIKVAV